MPNRYHEIQRIACVMCCPLWRHIDKKEAPSPIPDPDQTDSMQAFIQIIKGVSIRTTLTGPGERVADLVLAQCLVVAGGPQDREGFHAGPVSIVCRSWS